MQGRSHAGADPGDLASAKSAAHPEASAQRDAAARSRPVLVPRGRWLVSACGRAAMADHRALGTPHQGLPLLGVAYGPRGPASGSESVSEVWGGPRTRGPGSWPPRRASGPPLERSCPVRARRREPHQNCTTVPPSVMTGGSAEPVRFSLTNSAARFDDSSVPVLSWQTVTVKPPSSVRTAK